MASCKEYYLQRDGNLDKYNARKNNLSTAMKVAGPKIGNTIKQSAEDKKEIELTT